MKKVLLSLAMLAAGAGCIAAQEVTFEFKTANVSINAEDASKIVLTGTKSGNNVQPLQSAKYQDVTMTFAENGASTKPAWYASGDGDIRMYAKSGMTVMAPAGKTIEKIAFTFTSGWGATAYNGIEITTGTLDPVCSADNKPKNGMTLTWTKSENVTEVTFTVPAAKTFNTSNPQFRFAKAVVTLGNGGGGPVAPSAPEINGPATFYGNEATVTMTAAAGADIYYTMSATGEPADPTTASAKYQNEIVINGTTTFKAIAVKDGLSSKVATATFTKGEAVAVASIAEFLTKDNNTVCTFSNPVTVVGLYQKRYMFVEDASGALQIFDGSNSLDRPYEMGQTISGFTVQKSVYNNTPQGNAADFIATFPAVGTGVGHRITPTKIEATKEAVQANLNKYVYVTGPITKTGSNFFEGAIQLYDRFGLKQINDDLVNQEKDVAGFVVMFKDTPEMYYTQVASPNTLSVNGIEEGNVAIYGAEGYVVAPEGAQIYNLSGMKVANANLAKGIYLVRYNGTTTKVVVK